MIFLLTFLTSVGGGERPMGSAHYAGLMPMNNSLKNPLHNWCFRDEAARVAALLSDL
jgi:hypothetical protein